MKLPPIPLPTLLMGVGALLCASPLLHAQAGGSAKPMPPLGTSIYGEVRLVDEVDCSKTGGAHEFMERPEGISKVETILGVPTRTLPNEGEAKYFAYRIGKGKNLKPGAAYVLTVDYPEDKPRTIFVVNRGGEMVRGFRTGSALGDVLYTHTQNNVESLKVPLSGAVKTWNTLFYMHDRTFPLGLESDKANNTNKSRRTVLPDEGFWVAIAISKAENDPASVGAAASKIRLLEVVNPDKLKAAINLPPAGLPQRHLFWREEMADGVMMDKEPERGVLKQTDWVEYKVRLMLFLAMNTYSKDFLEFGHNQGWDSGPNNDWFNASAYPKLWEEILTAIQKYDVNVLPYYEYTGGVGKKGLGNERRARPLTRDDAFTHIHWTEKRNVDVTDPDTLAEANRVLDATIIKHKDKAKFVGAWFRPRPSQFAIGFGEGALERFAKDANNGTAITREQLRSDEALLNRYYEWWYLKRREFLAGMRDHLRENGIKDAAILLTSDSNEPGKPLKMHNGVVTDDVDTWKQLLTSHGDKTRAHAFTEIVSQDKQFEALTTMRGTWGKWEWQHSDPPNDPQNYKDQEGIHLTYSFNRNYTTASTKGLEAFRNKSGLAAIYHYPLNEHSMEKSLGYIATDVEYAGPHMMMPEARLMANGEPKYLGYLAASSFNRGFPEYARAFNAAFLALPALPSTVLKEASTDAEVVVRSIPTQGHGTYYAIVNTGMTDKKVTITLPAGAKVENAATKEALKADGGKLQVAMYPCQLLAVRVQ